MALRPVTSPAICDNRDDDHQSHDRGDDRHYQDPSWDAGSFAVGARLAAVAGFSPGMLVGHSGPPWFRRSGRAPSAGQFTIQNVTVKSECIYDGSPYTWCVPRLWTQTIESHRREVRDAILDVTAELVAEHGLLSVTMSQIAERAGIGRATLYKYFPDVETILRASHEREINAHLSHLAEVRDKAGEPGERLEAVLEAYALLAHHSRRHHGAELAAILHPDQHVMHAQQHVRGMIQHLLVDGVAAGEVRDDVSPDELVSYCLHALTAASALPSKAAVWRLVEVTMTGLRPPR